MWGCLKVLYLVLAISVIYNDLHCAIRYCKIHHFPNDTLSIIIKSNNKIIIYEIYQAGLMLTRVHVMSVNLNLFCLIDLKTA